MVQKLAAMHLDLSDKLALENLLDEISALRTSVTTLTAKLDADATVTDTNYAALCNPAAAVIVK